MKKSIVTLAAFVAVAGISACSAGGGEAAGPVPSALSASAPSVGGDPASLAPVVVTPDQNGDTVYVVPGQAVLVKEVPDTDALNDIVIESDDPKVAFPVQRNVADDVQTDPLVVAGAVGTATVTVSDTTPGQGDAVDPVMQFKVQVDPAK